MISTASTAHPIFIPELTVCFFYLFLFLMNLARRLYHLLKFTNQLFISLTFSITFVIYVINFCLYLYFLSSTLCIIRSSFLLNL